MRNRTRKLERNIKESLGNIAFINKKNPQRTHKNQNNPHIKGNYDRENIKTSFLSGFIFIFGIVVLFGPLISDENYDYDSNQNIIGLNLSPEVLKYKPLVEKYANKYEIG